MLPALSANMRFDEASHAVVAYLQATIPMGFWSVTRYDGERQVYLEVDAPDYGTAVGDSVAWSESLCQHAVVGDAPEVAPDVEQVEIYRTAPVRETVAIGAYIGVPIYRGNGELYGTLCGLDPAPRGAELTDHHPLLRLLTGLLGTVLEADLEHTAIERDLERAELAAETDALTGLLNRRGWDRVLTMEEDRYRRFGDACTVVVVDLDDLKVVNDSQGHDAGDAYLQLAARTLTAAVRPTDVVARLGGDEFGVLLDGVGSERAVSLVQRLQATLDECGAAGSCGHASYTIAGGLARAVRDADAAMYAQKRTRRGASARHRQG